MSKAAAVGRLVQWFIHVLVGEPKADDRREVLSAALCYTRADSAVHKQTLFYDKLVQIDW